MIYLDNAATTRVRPEVIRAMVGAMEEGFGNPSSQHGPGRAARALVDRARRQVSGLLGVAEDRVLFTSCGTEAINWVIEGVRRASPNGHIVTSTIEHHAVLHAVERAVEQGMTATYVSPDATGRIHPEAVREAIGKDTCLVSIMMANNEIGTLEPIEEIARVCRDSGVLLHVDAVQAAGHVPIRAQEWGVDMMSISGHKFGAPKGTGALYVREGVVLPPLIVGGGQEKNQRSGTENVPGIVGMGMAAELAMQELPDEMARIEGLRRRLIAGMSQVKGVTFNGNEVYHLPGVVSMTFRGIESESLLLLLDMQGFAVSSGSACSAGAGEPSHVLASIGLDSISARGTLRISIGRENTMEDIEALLAVLPGMAERLFALSPLVRGNQ
nr:cysteine desulfurase family protein [bacterium]